MGGSGRREGERENVQGWMGVFFGLFTGMDHKTRSDLVSIEFIMNEFEPLL